MAERTAAWTKLSDEERELVQKARERSRHSTDSAFLRDAALFTSHLILKAHEPGSDLDEALAEFRRRVLGHDPEPEKEPV